MFDKTYFESEFPRQLEAVGDRPVVRFSLNGGAEEIWVRSIDELPDGYLTVVVYRPPGSRSYANKDGQGTDSPAAITYEAIDAVSFSNSTEEQRPQVGFVYSVSDL